MDTTRNKQNGLQQNPKWPPRTSQKDAKNMMPWIYNILPTYKHTLCLLKSNYSTMAIKLCKVSIECFVMCLYKMYLTITSNLTLTDIGSREGHSQSIQSLQKNGNKVTAPHEMAEVLNAQFQSVFTTESQESCPYVQRIAPVVPDLVITESGVNKLLRALKISKSSWVDNLPTRPFKECAVSISQVLTFIFNHTLADGNLPDGWRSASITSIFKKRPNDLANTYRPVSLTSVISKTMNTSSTHTSQTTWSGIISSLQVNMVTGVTTPGRPSLWLQLMIIRVSAITKNCFRMLHPAAIFYSSTASTPHVTCKISSCMSRSSYIPSCSHKQSSLTLFTLGQWICLSD